MNTFKAFLTGFYEGFRGYVRGGSGMSYGDGILDNAYDCGANWGERVRYGRSFGGKRW